MNLANFCVYSEDEVSNMVDLLDLILFFTIQVNDMIGCVVFTGLCICAIMCTLPTIYSCVLFFPLHSGYYQ